MPLTPGTTLGPYEILSPIGAGGMGEVYKARDTRLDRTVAIKVLPEHVANDPDLKQRFEREAKTISSLNHPHICTLHDIGSQDGIDFLVMEYLDGETVAQRLEKGALPLDQALKVAIEIADALDKAHRQGITHRDLKPGNIMLTKAGAKLLDFGLAKLKPAEAAGGLTALPTQSAGLTVQGTILGTIQYMAPEQLEGKEADARADIFAFGILLYEMLAGVHPFQRTSQSGTIAAILRDTPAPVSQYAKDAPETARVTLDRLLAKEPPQRYQSFGEVRTDLRQVLQEASGLTPLPPTAPATTYTTGGRTPFVGRESEREEARRLLDQAVAGQGGVLLLGGEPGIGKTRLAEEILADAKQRGCLALTGRCYETEGTPPFIPWVEMVERFASIVPHAAFREALGDAAPEVAKLVPELRRMFPDIPAPIELPPEQQRRYLFNSFLEFFKRGTRVTPQVVLIDDLHWADDSTLLLLQHVAQHASDMPLLIVGTYRDVDLDVARPFAKTLEGFTRQRLAHKVALRRLPDTGVREMLQALSGKAPPAQLVTAVFAETEGNPFFVEEVFQHLSEEGRLFDADGTWRADLRVEDLDVPEGIRLVIGRRVERLSQESRRVLTTAAVVGRSFDLNLLEALGDAEGDTLLTALEEAEAAKLILTVSSGREVRWEFAHGLIRQTLEASLSLMRRQRVHLRVAEAMERVYGDRVERHASDVAQHLYQAGVAADPDKTVRFLTLGGDQALDAGAFDEALRQFTDALSIQEEREGDQRVLADLHYKKGQALRSAGRPADAVDAWHEALSRFAALHDGEAIARAAYSSWYALVWDGNLSAARQELERGLDLVGDDASAWRCQLLALSAQALGAEGRVGGAGLIEQALPLAEDIGDERLLGVVLLSKAWHHQNYVQTVDALETARRAEALHRSTPSLWGLADGLSCAVLVQMYVGHLSEVRRIDEELEPLATRVGHIGGLCFNRMCRAWRELLMSGDLDTGVNTARSQCEYEQQVGFGWRMMSLYLLGNALMWRGDRPEARRAFQEAASLERGTVLAHSGSSALLLARVQSGDASAAIEMRQVELAARSHDANFVGAWDQLMNVVEGLAILGARDRAATLYQQVAGGLETGVVLSHSSRLWQMVAGIAAACGAQWEAAQEHYETALTQAHDLPHKIAQPEVRRWYAQMLLDRNAAGDRDKARTLLGEATEMYQTIGMPKHVEMVEKMSAEL